MASPTNLDHFDKKIKEPVRIISIKDSDHPSAPLYRDLKILPLSNSLELCQAKHMWKLINGFLPPRYTTLSYGVQIFECNLYYWNTAFVSPPVPVF